MLGMYYVYLTDENIQHIQFPEVVTVDCGQFKQEFAVEKIISFLRFVIL